MASIIIQWKTFGTTRTLLQSSLITGWAPEMQCGRGDGTKVSKDKPDCSPSLGAPWQGVQPEASVWNTSNKSHTDYQTSHGLMRAKSNFLLLTVSGVCGEHLVLLISCLIPTVKHAAASCCANWATGCSWKMVSDQLWKCSWIVEPESHWASLVRPEDGALPIFTIKPDKTAEEQ